MQGLLADLRFGLSELAGTPRSSALAAACLLAGLLLGAGSSRWLERSLAPPPVARAEPAARVPAAQLFPLEAVGRLRCLAGLERCDPAPLPCAVAPQAPTPGAPPAASRAPLRSAPAGRSGSPGPA